MPRESDEQLGSSRSPSRNLWIIFLVALLLRLAVITFGHTYRINPKGDHFQFGWEMGRIARSIASGEGFSSPTDLPTGPSAWAPPLYPYVLAGVFKIFGVYTAASAWVILAFNSIFGALTCITIYRIGARTYSERAALAAAWTWAVFPYSIYWPVRVVWEASLSAFLLSLVLLLILKMSDSSPRARDWALLGVLWGAIALTNTAMLSMLPLFLGWLLYRLPRRGLQLRRAVLCLGVFAAIMAPWLVRNRVVFGKFIFIRDNLPLELYVANNDRSNGLWTRSEHPGNDSEARQHFREIGELAFMQEKQRQFREFVREEPGKLTRFTFERGLYFWIGTPQNAQLGRYNLVALRHATFFIASALAFAGLWFTWRDGRRGVFLFACLLLLYPLPYCLVNPFPRYKHPIEPAMMLLIVYALARWKRTRPQPAD